MQKTERRRLEERLLRSRRRVEESARIVEDQRQRIEEGYRTGLLLPESAMLLDTFIASHDQFKAECAQLEALLAEDGLRD